MTAKATKTAMSHDYTEFLKSLRLIFVALVESRFSGDRERYLEQEEQRLLISWRCKPRKIKKESFDALTEVKVTVSESKAKGKTVFDLNAGFLLHLHASPPITREHIDRFTDSEVRLMVWPYVREYVTGICGRFHVPPIVVPFGSEDEGRQ